MMRQGITVCVIIILTPAKLGTVGIISIISGVDMLMKKEAILRNWMSLIHTKVATVKKLWTKTVSLFGLISVGFLKLVLGWMNGLM